MFYRASVFLYFDTYGTKYLLDHEINRVNVVSMGRQFVLLSPD